jgi:hypothetical protein
VARRAVATCALKLMAPPRVKALLHLFLNMTTLSAFADLVSKYATWADLSAFLESKEGGSLRVVRDEKNPRFVVVRYDKAKSDMSAAHVGYFRSVVWDTESNRPVCVAPVKAEKGLPPADVDVRAVDFMDGVMVNVWRGADGNDQLATRTSLGGSNRFYSKKTFAEMYLEACGGDASWVSKGLEGSAFTFASVVLQHPEHRVVHPVSSAGIAVVMLGSIAADGTVTLETRSAEFPPRFSAVAPRVFVASKKYKEPKDSLAEVSAHGLLEPAGWQGMVFQEVGGVRRWRVRNGQYVMLRGLRGGEPLARQRFARLRQAKSVKAYLKYYTEDQAAFWDCEKQLRASTNAIYDYYCRMNKAKEINWKQIPVSLRAHVYAVHGKFVKELREKKEKVTREVVVEYVNGLSAENILGLLREHPVPPPEAAAPAAPAPVEAPAAPSSE